MLIIQMFLKTLCCSQTNMHLVDHSRLKIWAIMIHLEYWNHAFQVAK